MATEPLLAAYTAEQDTAWGEALATNLHGLYHIGRPLSEAVVAAARDCSERGRVDYDSLDGRARRRTLRAARELTLQVWGAANCAKFGGCGEPANQV